MELRASGDDEILVIDRAGFDRSLAGRAVKAGAQVRTGARVDGLVVHPGGVEVQVGSEGVRARACILACGVSYRLQRQLGLGLPGQVAHAAQIELRAKPSDTVEWHFGRSVAPTGFALLRLLLR